MIVLRQAPKKDFGTETMGQSDVGPFDVTFEKRCRLEDVPAKRIVVRLASTKLHKNEKDLDRHIIVMSPSEVVLLFATIPAEHMVEAVNQFEATTKDHQRVDPDGPHCAVTKKEFADRLVELFRATLDWK